MGLSSRSSPWQRRVSILAPPLVVAVFAAALFRSVERRRASTDAVEHTYRVIGHLDELRARLVDAETGQRGYVITGDTTYLEPYRHAGRDSRALLSTLRAETRGDAAQQRALDSLDGLVDRRLGILDRRLDLRRVRGFEAARESLIAGGGKEAMDRIRAALAQSRVEQRGRLAAQARAEARDGRTLLWVLFLGAAAVAGVAVLTGALFGRDARLQRRLNADLRGANARLRDQAVELEAQTEELQSQAAQLEETMAELECSNDEMELQRVALEELTVDLAATNHRLHASNEALEARTVEAEAANRAKSEFLAAMSHELRTPLNAIAGYADLMELGVQGPLTDAQRNALARIRYNEQHLLALINDVLNFARIEAGKIELRISDVAAGELLEEMGGVVEPLMRAQGLAFEVEPCEPWVRLRGDRDRVAQVLLNLLSNAVKCTDAGGRVRLWAEGDAERVRIRVSDTGRGIAAGKLEAIFDPFVQLAPEKTLTQGVGLGLSISRELARGMNGELSVESVPGEGSTFTLTLPHALRIPAQKIVEAPASTGAADGETVAG